MHSGSHSAGAVQLEAIAERLSQKLLKTKPLRQTNAIFWQLSFLQKPRLEHTALEACPNTPISLRVSASGSGASDLLPRRGTANYLMFWERSTWIEQSLIGTGWSRFLAVQASVGHNIRNVMVSTWTPVWVLHRRLAEIDPLSCSIFVN